MISILFATFFSQSAVIDSGGTQLLERIASSKRPWKVELTIAGTKLPIPLQGHYIIHPVRPPSLRPLLIGRPDLGPNSTSDITAITTFHLLDEAQTVVDVADTVSGKSHYD